jgi:hypothetical protein
MDKVWDTIMQLVNACGLVLEFFLTPTGNVVGGLLILSAIGMAVWLTRRKTPAA